MKRFKPEEIPCQHYLTWRENQAPLGSGMNWTETFEDCAWDGDDTKIVKAMEADDHKCGPSCPAYKPVEIKTCPEHGEYLAAETCWECLALEEIEAQRGAEEYWSSLEERR